MTESFAELFEQSQTSLNNLKSGAIVTGTVEEIRADVVVVNVGLKSEGVIDINQFRNEQGEIEVAVGDIVKVALEAVENGFGETILSRDKAKKALVWDELETVMDAGEIVTGRISGKVKGGFTVDIREVRAFLPGSLVDVRPVRDPGYLEGKELEFKIIKLDRKRNNVVVSRRAVVETENSAEREQMLERLTEGTIVTGVVKNLTDYGAFVDLGGVDGLLHISRLAWTRVKHPSEVLTVGQGVKVKVTSIDAETGKIGLSLRDLGGDPWVQVPHKYKQGDVIRGPVVRILDRVGAFVQLEPGVDGLVHISEIDYKRVFRIQDFVKEGQTVEAKIMSIDMEQKRVGLSMKAIMARPEPVSKASPEVEEAEAEPETPPLPLPSFPKKLKGGVAKKSGGAEFGLKW